MLELLPLELIKIIITYDNETWWKCCTLSKNFNINFNDQKLLKVKFLRRFTDTDLYIVEYRLPNGCFHNGDDPTIDSEENQKWYKDNKFHRDKDY